MPIILLETLVFYLLYFYLFITTIVLPFYNFLYIAIDYIDYRIFYFIRCTTVTISFSLETEWSNFKMSGTNRKLLYPACTRNRK